MFCRLGKEFERREINDRNVYDKCAHVIIFYNGKGSNISQDSKHRGALGAEASCLFLECVQLLQQRLGVIRRVILRRKKMMKQEKKMENFIVECFFDEEKK
jgi:hypothetical protein